MDVIEKEGMFFLKRKKGRQVPYGFDPWLVDILDRQHYVAIVLILIQHVGRPKLGFSFKPLLRRACINIYLFMIPPNELFAQQRRGSHVPSRHELKHQVFKP